MGRVMIPNEFETRVANTLTFEVVEGVMPCEVFVLNSKCA